jgi:cellulose synthase (UDP-forming)
MFLTRLWGARRLYRHQISWTNALALRILRVPVGLSCVWWLLTRKTLEFQVTPKEGTEQRLRSGVPRILGVMLACLGAVLAYAVAGLAGVVPWRTSPGATVASGTWLLLAAATVTLGMLRIRAEEHASSRRNAHRFAVPVTVVVEGYRTDLVDISVGGLRVRMPRGTEPGPGLIQVELPGSEPVKLTLVRVIEDDAPHARLVSLRVVDGDWAGMRALSLWLFHTPSGAVPNLPAGIPAAACTVPSEHLSARRNRAAVSRVRLAVAIAHG